MMTAIEANLEGRKLPDAKCLSGAVELAMLSHDIRSALNGVLGGISLIDTSSLPAETGLQVERVRAASNILASLITQAIGEDCMDGERSTCHRSVAVDDFREFLLQRWKGEADSLDVTFEVVADADLPYALDCSAVDLSRMVGNLVSNSIRHARSSNVVVRISRAPLGGINLEVRDTGPGISDAVLRAVSRPGFGSRIRIDEQHGIGLQIVKSLATERGGWFSLRNDPDGGAIAAIWLPERYCLWESPAGCGPVLPQRQAAFASLAGLRVLLAEDNPTNQMVASQMLEALQAEVTVCSDGVEALDAYSNGSFDLLVVDIEMPRLSGLGVIRAIRALPDERARVPIVALTAYALREHRERIAAAGASGLISKPITSIEDLGRSLVVHLATPRDWQKTAGKLSSVATSGPEVESVLTAIDRAVYDSLVAAIGAEMREELLEKVMADLAGARDELEEALATLDMLTIRAASHILISVGGAIGASRVLETARVVNSSAHENDSERLPGEIRACLAALDHAIAFVREEHDKRKG
jgi:two-component system, OmpR family, aerobic respiration control sensor histidine kinase ArcB